MRKIVPLAVAGAVVLVASGGTLGYATLDKEVTLSVDGEPTTFNTFSRTVGDVLEDKNISVGPNDVVAPGTDAKLTEGSEIAVKYGRKVTVSIDGDKRSFWTTARDVRGALQSAGIEAADAKLSTSRSTSIGRDGLSWTIDTEKKIKINAGGESQTVQTTARTVKGALGAAKIKPDSDDKVSAKLNATIEDGDKITVVDVQVKKSTKKQSIDYDTTYRDSDELYEDETEVKTEGKEGERTLSYQKTFHNGKLKNKKLVSDKVTTKAVDEVILQGTKERPEPEPEPEPEEDTSSEDSGSSDSSSDDSSSGGSSGSDSSDSESSDSGSSDSSDSGSDDAPAVASGSVWDQLAQCESGGDWSINTGNGFYGGLQFTLQTWEAFGGSGMPHEASREEQIRVAENVKDGQGWGAWPSCSSQLGLY